MNNRLVYNRAIVDKLLKLIEKYPDFRFGQLLVNTEIIQYCSDLNEQMFVKDPFNEESETIWNRMINNKICFE